MLTKTVSVQEGIFIPRSLLPVGGEWVVMIVGQEIILRPKMDRREAHTRMRQLRETLRETYGVFPDSSELIRQDRDER